MKLKKNLSLLLIAIASISFIGCSNKNIPDNKYNHKNSINTNETNDKTDKTTGLYTALGKVKEININPKAEECDCVLEGQLTKGTVLLEGEIEALAVINEETKIIKDNQLVDISELCLNCDIEVKFKGDISTQNPIQGIAETINIVTN